MLTCGHRHAIYLRKLRHKSIEVTHQINGHLVASSFDRARTALDAAYLKSQKQRRPGN